MRVTETCCGLMPARLAHIDREKQSEVARWNAMKGRRARMSHAAEPSRSAVPTPVSASRAGSEIEKGIEHIIDQPVGKAVQLEDSSFGKNGY